MKFSGNLVSAEGFRFGPVQNIHKSVEYLFVIPTSRDIGQIQIQGCVKNGRAVRATFSTRATANIWLAYCKHLEKEMVKFLSGIVLNIWKQAGIYIFTGLSSHLER